MREPFHTEQYKDYTIELHRDEHAESPREWCNIGTMCCYHRRYALGDKNVMSMEDVQQHVLRDDVISLPIYMYDHSGIALSVTPFSCKWDSGQLGVIYVDADVAQRELPKREGETDEAWRTRVELCLRQEVEVYDKWQRGDFCGYIVKRGDEEVGSCWGYDDESYALSEARENADYDERERFPLLTKLEENT